MKDFSKKSLYDIFKENKRHFRRKWKTFRRKVYICLIDISKNLKTPKRHRKKRQNAKMLLPKTPKFHCEKRQYLSAKHGKTPSRKTPKHRRKNVRKIRISKDIIQCLNVLADLESQDPEGHPEHGHWVSGPKLYPSRGRHGCFKLEQLY